MKLTPFTTAVTTATIAVRTKLHTLTTTVSTYYRRVKMIPQAISDALSGAVTSSQAMQGKVPQGTVLGADDVNAIVSQIGAIQNAINATAAALDALAPAAPAAPAPSGTEVPVG